MLHINQHAHTRHHANFGTSNHRYSLAAGIRYTLAPIISNNRNLMNKLKAYWIFHKSTVILNLVSSAALSLITLPVFLVVFPILIMTSGTLISLFYKEITHKNEYYFYYNLGISKPTLLVMNEFFNILTGLILLGIFSYVKHT